MLDGAGRRVDEVAGVGIGVPGPVEFATGRPRNPPIMPGWDGFDIPAFIGEYVDAPVLVDNDVNLMALGEFDEGWRDVRHLLFVKIATGIGAGIVADGRLNRGAQGSAGDLGHVRSLGDSQTECTCGNVGCLEAVAAGPAIAARLRERGLAADSTADVVDLVRAGNAAALQEVRQAGRDIGARPGHLREPAQSVGDRDRRPIGRCRRAPVGRSPRGGLSPLPAAGHPAPADLTEPHRISGGCPRSQRDGDPVGAVARVGRCTPGTSGSAHGRTLSVRGAADRGET